MNYLKDAVELAQSRNYLQYAEVQSLLNEVPDWFRSLGTENGLLQFEAKYQKQVPVALQEFYKCLPLACFLEKTIDGNVFFGELDNEDLPLIVNWSSVDHLAFAFHGHSGSVCAAGFDNDNPLVRWGFEDEEKNFDDASEEMTFSQWIFLCVDGYEKKLQYWFNFYQNSNSKSNLQWIKKMPGMIEKFGEKFNS
jgi:hypothetical protein